MGEQLLCWSLEPVPWVMQLGTGPGPILPSLSQDMLPFTAIMGLLVGLSTHLKPPGGQALVLNTGSATKEVFRECLQDDNSVLSLGWCVPT